MAVVRRRSRRRKSSYRDEPGDSGLELRLEDLSPRARRLVESGVIDVSTIAGSGQGGLITSGDILERARLMEKEQSLARIEAINGERSGDAAESHAVARPVEPQADVPHVPQYPVAIREPESGEAEAGEPSDADTPEEPEMPEMTEISTFQPEPLTRWPAEPVAPDASVVSDPEATSTWSAEIAGEPIGVPPSPWDAYNGSTEGLSEIALPGADRSWGEAEANIAAIAEEAAAQLYRRPEAQPVPVDSAPEPGVSGAREVEAAAEGPAVIHEEEDSEQPEHDVESLDTEVMMDFGTLESVDPVSVWAEGAEDFAPWFLANSKQLGEVLGLRAGLSDPRQYTTKSATGVLGRDDQGEQVVVVASHEAAADDSDLGRALGMAASSGAATVALVSATFGDEQLQALDWLNGQTKSGVKWFGVEMRVVRIADSPPAMMFTLVASPPQR